MLKRTGSQEMPWGSGLANRSKQVQSSPAQQKTSLESTGGHAGNQQQRWRGQPSLAEEDQERQFEARRFHHVVRFHTSGLSWTVTVLHASIS